MKSQRLKIGRFAAAMVAVTAVATATLVPATGAAAAGESAQFSFTALTPATQLTGVAHEYLASVSCSAVAGSTCNDLTISIPFPNDPDPTLGGTAIANWSIATAAQAGVVNPTVNRDTVNRVWSVTFARPLVAGENVGVTIKITAPSGRTPSGLTANIQPTLSGSNVEPISAGGLPLITSATPTTQVLKKLVSSSLIPGGNARYSLQLTDGIQYSGQTGVVYSQANRRTLVDRLPAGIDFVSAEPSSGVYDPIAHTVTWDTAEAGFPVPIGQVPMYYVNGKVKVDAAVGSVQTNTAELTFRTIGQADDQTKTSVVSTTVAAGISAASLFTKQVGGNLAQIPAASSPWSSANAVLNDQTDAEVFYQVTAKSDSNPISWKYLDSFACIAPSVQINAGTENSALCANPSFRTSRIVLTQDSNVTTTGDQTDKTVTVVYSDGTEETYSPRLGEDFVVSAGKIVSRIGVSGDHAASSASTVLRFYGRLSSDTNPMTTTVTNNVRVGAVVQGLPVSYTTAVGTAPLSIIRSNFGLQITTAPTYSITTNPPGAQSMTPTVPFFAPEDSTLKDARMMMVLPKNAGLKFQTSANTDNNWNDTGRDAKTLRPRDTQSPQYGLAYQIASDGAQPGVYPYDLYAWFDGADAGACRTIAGAVSSTNDRFIDSSGLFGPEGVETSVCHLTGSIVVTGPTPGFTVTKSVRAAGDSEWTQSPGSSTVPSDGTGEAQFKINWANTGSMALSSAVVYDVLPAVGDTGSVGALAGEPRGSTFTPTLKSVAGASGWTTYYSTAANPCRPEVMPTNDGCDPTWVSIAPPLETVKALKFVKTTASAVGVTAEFQLSMLAPAFDPDTDTAWNTVATHASLSGNPSALVPTESSRVGFGLVRVSSIGVTKEVCSNGSDCDMLAPVGTDGWSDNTQVDYDATATWRVVVENTGATDLSDVEIVDAAVAGCSFEVGDLPLSSGTYVRMCSSAHIRADLTNSATVTGVGDGKTVSAAGSATATVAPKPASSLSVTKQACNPAAGECDPDADLSASEWSGNAAVPFEGSVVWRVVVANTGDTALTNVRVEDPTNSACATTIETLAAGAFETTSCTNSMLTAPLTNSASAAATPPFGDPDLTQASTATVTPAQPTPSISVVKEVCSGDDCDADAAQNEGGWSASAAVDYFGSVTWRVVVTNTGETSVAGISVADEVAPGCAAGPFDLARGASRTITCESEQLTADLTNEAVARGTAPGAIPVSHADTATVTVADKPVSSMTVVKEACNPLVNGCAAGSAVGADGWASAGHVLFEGDGTWRVRVTNTGATTLTNIRAVDANSAECSFVVASLAPGASKDVVCDEPSVSTVVTNTATVSATPPFGDADLSHTVTATLTPAAAVPGVVFVKEVCDSDDPCQQNAALGEGGWSDTATVDYNGSVQWRLTVVNSGQTVLTSVVVSDPLVAGCAADELGPIARGAQASVMCESAELRSDMVNTATAEIADSLSNSLTQNASASVTIGTAKPESAVDVMKESCDPAANGCADDAALGTDGWSDSTLVPFLGTSKWRVTIANTGATTLTNVRVTDESALQCAWTVDSLAPGESDSRVCDEAALDGTITNEASVLATPPFGDPDLSDTASATTTSQEPLVLLTLSQEICSLPEGCDPNVASLTGGWVTATQIEPGESASWRVVIANEGQVSVTDVVVTDVAGFGCSAEIGELASGAVHVVTCVTDGLLSTVVGESHLTATNPRNGETLAVADSGETTATVRDFAAAVSLTKQACFVSEGADCAEEGTGWKTHAIGDFGAELWWKITVINTGDTVLRDISVVDEKFPEGNVEISELAAGESKSLVFSAGAWKQLDPNADSAANEALVSALSVAGDVVNDSSMAIASVAPPATSGESKNEGGESAGSSTAAATELSVTGGADSGFIAGVAALLTVIGLAAVVLRRRRTA